MDFAFFKNELPDELGIDVPKVIIGIYTKIIVGN